MFFLEAAKKKTFPPSTVMTEDESKLHNVIVKSAKVADSAILDLCRYLEE